MNSDIFAINFAFDNLYLNDRKLSANVNLEKRMISDIFAFGISIIKYQWLSSLAMFQDSSKSSIGNLIYLMFCSKVILSMKYDFSSLAAEIKNNIATLQFTLLN